MINWNTPTSQYPSQNTLAGLGIAHIHYPLEGCQQGVRHVVGQAPEQKERGYQRERQQVFFLQCFHFSESNILVISCHFSVDFASGEQPWKRLT